jgi:mannose-6-phosphate isomerase-like protein (cupin superfamily)
LKVERILTENPLKDGENLKITALGQFEGMSHHLVQIRNREVPHLHKSHDLAVFMLRTKGHLMLDGKRIDLRSGDVLTIQRGSVHYFVNEDSRPAVIFAIYAPPFDGKDFVSTEGFTIDPI